MYNGIQDLVDQAINVTSWLMFHGIYISVSGNLMIF